jgi:RNA polymerase sigma-70 factor (family 1)
MKQAVGYLDEGLLLKAFKSNDLCAFREVYDIHYHQLLNYATRFISDSDQAEDVISESFVVVWQKRGEFESLKSITAFLYTITRNACLSQLKKDKRKAENLQRMSYLKSETNTEDITNAIKADLIQYALIAAAQLPPETKKVFQLLYIEGYSAIQAAEKLGRSVHTVRAQKTVAVKKIRETLIKKGLLLVFI